LLIERRDSCEKEVEVVAAVAGDTEDGHSEDPRPRKKRRKRGSKD